MSRGNTSWTVLKRRFGQYATLQDDDARDQNLDECLACFYELNITPKEPVETLEERFPDVRVFLFHLSRRFCREVKQRAERKSRSVAAATLLEFFKGQNPADPVGALLLAILEYISEQTETLLEPVIRASLPCTLVKCIQLFLDTPEESTVYNADLAARILDLLRQISKTKGVFELLAQSDDLELLYNAAASIPPQHNRVWRTVAQDTMLAMARRFEKSDFISYLRSTEYVNQSLVEIIPSEVNVTSAVNIITNLTAVLRVLSDADTSLIQDFDDSNGYEVLVAYILREDEAAANEQRAVLNDALKCITILFDHLLLGTEEINPNILDDMVGYRITGGDSGPVQADDERDFRVSNLRPLNRLVDLFDQLKTGDLRGMFLDSMMNVCSMYAENFVIIHSQRSLDVFLAGFETNTPEIRMRLLKLFEFVICSVGFVPLQCVLFLKDKYVSIPSDEISLEISSLFHKMIKFDDRMVDVLDKVDLPSSLMLRLRDEAQAGRPTLSSLILRDFLSLLSEILKVSTGVALVFFEDIAPRVLEFVYVDDLYPQIMYIVQTGLRNIQKIGVPLTRTIFELLNSIPLTQVDILLRLMRDLTRFALQNDQIKSYFRDSGTFTFSNGVLGNFSGRVARSVTFDLANAEEFVCLLIDFQATISYNNQANRAVFIRQYCYGPALPSNMQTMDIIGSEKVYNKLFQAAQGVIAGDRINFRRPDNGLIPSARHEMLPIPEIMSAVLQIAFRDSRERRLSIFDRILELVQRKDIPSYQQKRLVEVLSQTRFLKLLLISLEYSDIADEQLMDRSLQLIKILGRCRILASELKVLLKIYHSATSDVLRKDLLRVLSDLTPDPDYGDINPPDCLELDGSKLGYAGIILPVLQEQQFGMPFSASLWFQMAQNDPNSDGNGMVPLFRVVDLHHVLGSKARIDASNGTVFGCGIDARTGRLIVSFADGTGHLFTFSFNTGQWYNLTITVAHLKADIKKAVCQVAVDGMHLEAYKFRSASMQVSAISESQCYSSLVLGSLPNDLAARSVFIVRFSNFFMWDCVLSHTAPGLIFNAGINYNGSFSDRLKSFQTYEILTPEAISQLNGDFSNLGSLDLGKSRSQLPAMGRQICGLPCNDLMPMMLGNIDSRSLSVVKSLVRMIPCTDNRLPFYGTSNVIAKKPGKLSQMAFLIGGASAYAHQRIPESIHIVGGMALVLKMVADTDSSEELELMCAFLTKCVRYCAVNTREMERTVGWHILSLILANKYSLVTENVVDHLFRISGSQSNPKLAVLCNSFSLLSVWFKFDTWKHCTLTVQKRITHHLLAIFEISDLRKFNIWRVQSQRFPFMERVLEAICSAAIKDEVRQDLVRLLFIFTCEINRCAAADCGKLRTFLLSTIADVKGNESCSTSNTEIRDSFAPGSDRAIAIRNDILEGLWSLTRTHSVAVTELLTTRIGINVFQILMHPGCNEYTQDLCLQIILRWHQVGDVHRIEGVDAKYQVLMKVSNCLTSGHIGSRPVQLLFAAALGVDLKTFSYSTSDDFDLVIGHIIESGLSGENRMRLQPACLHILVEVAISLACQGDQIPMINAIMKGLTAVIKNDVSFRTCLLQYSSIDRMFLCMYNGHDIVNETADLHRGSYKPPLAKLSLLYKDLQIARHGHDQANDAASKKGLSGFLSRMIQNADSPSVRMELERSKQSTVFDEPADIADWEIVDYKDETEPNEFETVGQSSQQFVSADIVEVMKPFLQLLFSLELHAVSTSTPVFVFYAVETPATTLETPQRTMSARLWETLWPIVTTESVNAVEQATSRTLHEVTDKVLHSIIRFWEPAITGYMAVTALDVTNAFLMIIRVLIRRNVAIDGKYLSSKIPYLRKFTYGLLSQVSVDLLEGLTTATEFARLLMSNQDVFFAESNKSEHFYPLVLRQLFKSMNSTNVTERNFATEALIGLVRMQSNRVRTLLIEGEYNLYNNGLDLIIRKDQKVFLQWWKEHSLTVLAYMENRILKESEDIVNRVMIEATQTMRSLVSKQRYRIINRGCWERLENKRMQTLDQSHQKILIKAMQNEKHNRLQLRQKLMDFKRWLITRWSHIEKDLDTSMSIWLQTGGHMYEKWQLLSTEGPGRQRIRVIHHNDFFKHFPWRPEFVNAPRQPIAEDSKNYWLNEQHSARQRLSILDLTDLQIPEIEEDYPEDKESDGLPVDEDLEMAVPDSALGVPTNSGLEMNTNGPAGLGVSTAPSRVQFQTSSSNTLEVKSEAAASQGPGEPKEAADQRGGQEEDRDDDKDDDGVMVEADGDVNVEKLGEIQRLLEPGDSPIVFYNGARGNGSETVICVILICKNNLYFVDNYWAEAGGTIIDLLTFDKSSDPLVGTEIERRTAMYRSVNPHASQGHECVILPYGEIRELFLRRFLLQQNSVEVFSSTGRNYFIVVQPTERDALVANLAKRIGTVQQQAVNANTDNNNEFDDISGGVLANDVAYSSMFSNARSVQQRWLAGEISNFRYLMHLNTLAGRTYNDFTQYPVFPWVVNEFDTPELDVTDRSVFRDLRAPMGAQSDARAAQFKERFELWEDPEGKIPPFHYGTHYSSAMIVSSYLIRTEPFSHQFVRLQGGLFDHPDRLFHSIKGAWMSASQMSTTDVRELTPEFFYFPDFLINKNRLVFGAKQANGEVIDDVVLPTWAHGDQRYFVLKHRQALESKEVSRNIHHWIDLIFGYKQRGEPAAKALNVFHHLSYEGSADVHDLDDPVEREATIGIINNFGQTPRQLFKKAHPQRKSVGDHVTGTVFQYPHLLVLSQPTMPSSLGPHHGNTIGHIGFRGSGHVPVVQPPDHVNINTISPRILSWRHADGSVRLWSTEGNRLLHSAEGLHAGQVLSLAVVRGSKVVTGGADSLVSVWHLRTGQTIAWSHKKTLYGHTAPVISLTASSEWSIICSGSEDKSVLVWDLNSLDLVSTLKGHEDDVTHVHVSKETGDIFTVSDSMVRMWDINGNLMCFVDTQHRVLSMTMTTGPAWEMRDVLVTGHSKGLLQFWTCRFGPEDPERSKQELNTRGSQIQLFQDDPSDPLIQESPDNTPHQSQQSLSEEEVAQRSLKEIHEQETTPWDGHTGDSSDTLPVTADEEIPERLPTPRVKVKIPSGSLVRSYEDLSNMLAESFNQDDEEKNVDVIHKAWNWHFILRAQHQTAGKSVTAIAITPDNKRLYFGDECGRMFSLSPADASIVADPTLSVPELWRECHCCKSDLHEDELRVCRRCGHVFCGECCHRRVPVEWGKNYREVIVCDHCRLEVANRARDQVHRKNLASGRVAPLETEHLEFISEPKNDRERSSFRLVTPLSISNSPERVLYPVTSPRGVSGSPSQRRNDAVAMGSPVQHGSRVTPIRRASSTRARPVRRVSNLVPQQ
eukprot:Clim_evm65s119 gene=Clim_evmTU65s119